MIINFKSIITHERKDNEIQFAANVMLSKYEDYDVYEFKEPSKNEMNRIEISETKINIIAGRSTIELELDKKISIVYDVGQGQTILIDSLLHSLSKEDEIIKFNYSLFSNEAKIGDYKITLEIKE